MRAWGWAVLLLLTLYLSACAPAPLSSRCWNDAIYAYNCARLSGYEARVYIQETPNSDKGVYHAQAVAFVNGKAIWLNVYG